MTNADCIAIAKGINKAMDVVRLCDNDKVVVKMTAVVISAVLSDNTPGFDENEYFRVCFAKPVTNWPAVQFIDPSYGDHK